MANLLYTNDPITVASAAFLLSSISAGTIGLYIISVVVYRLWFHPFARYPGPFLARVSNIYGGYHAWRGSLHIDMLKCHDKYGSFVRYSPNRLLVNTATGLKDIYDSSANVQKSSAYLALQHRAPNILTTVDKKAHGRRRRILSQGLSDLSTRGFGDTFKKHIDKLCNQIDECLGTNAQWSKNYDMSRWSSYLTFDIMADVVFGQQYDLLGNHKYHYVVDSIEGSNIRTSVLLQAPEAYTCRLDRRLFPKSIQHRNSFIKFITRLVLDRMTKSPLKRNDIIMAGTDTSSTTVAATLFYLTHHPNLYRRAAAEIRSAFASSKDVRLGPVLNSCVFTRSCIEESLPMSPPAGSALWREVLRGGQTVDGHVIPAGCDVGVGIYAIHHNELYFPESFLFNPDRWVSNDEGGVEKVRLARSAYNPFSTGPRSCIGKGLAMSELILIIASLLSKFEIRRSPGPKRCIGQGDLAAGDGRHCTDEFQLYDHVTAYKEGPMLQFRRRQDAF